MNSFSSSRSVALPGDKTGLLFVQRRQSAVKPLEEDRAKETKIDAFRALSANSKTDVAELKLDSYILCSGIDLSYEGRAAFRVIDNTISGSTSTSSSPFLTAGGVRMRKSKSGPEDSLCLTANEATDGLLAHHSRPQTGADALRPRRKFPGVNNHYDNAVPHFMENYFNVFPVTRKDGKGDHQA